jgi:hypothetical protein
MKYTKTVLAAAAVVATLASGAFASELNQPPAPLQLAQAEPTAPPPGMVAPGQHKSNKDIWHRRRQLEHIIQDLGSDQADYGGFKAKAMQDLEVARQDLLQAEEYARTHGY